MYKKIFINGPESLPKENGRYFVGFTITIGVVFPSGTAWFTNDNGGNTKYWLDQIDWYLIESPISVPTEEEIDKRFPYAGSLTDYEAQIGAKWAIDEILKRNK